MNSSQIELPDNFEILDTSVVDGKEVIIVRTNGVIERPSVISIVHEIEASLNTKDRAAMDAIRCVTKGFGSGPTTQPVTPRRKGPGRNDPCPCQSGRKWKKCCGVRANQPRE